jgi:membrane-bound lytic murein transglycosylase A
MRIPSAPAILRTLALVGLVSTATLLPACTPPPPHPYWDLPPFGADDVALYRAFEKSCTKFANQPATRPVGASATSNKIKFGTYGQWQEICKQGLANTPDQLTLTLAKLTKQVEMPASGTENSKFTGYFKPMLVASRTKQGEFIYPLVERPADLTTCDDGSTGQRQPDGSCVSPYPNRGSIETAIRNGDPRYKPIAWLKDPIDAFFLHVQGSGTLEIEDAPASGKGPRTSHLMHIGFAGKNGHPYVAIGKVLRDSGELTGNVTADSIRKWLKANPHRADEVLFANPSFIFFTETPEESVGAFGVQLTPGRSLAVDRTHIPLGLPVRVVTELTGSNESFDRLMFAQDVGSAIKGSARGDIYFGHGPAAGKVAGTQNAPGHLFVLVPNSQALAAK